jgi:steroid 5-alpha reductase family enzyme
MHETGPEAAPTVPASRTRTRIVARNTTAPGESPAAGDEVKNKVRYVYASMTDRGRAILVCLLAYATAGAVAVGAGWRLSGAHPIVVAAAGDLAATLVVFGFSFALDNSSLYDPYWSVAPPAIGLYWALAPVAAGVSRARQLVALLLAGLWAARLTWNFLRGWQGLGHEDWRYVDFRATSGRAYWLVSLLGIHLFPTVMVFVGCLSLFPGLSAGTRPLGLLDVVAIGVTAAAIGIEATADEQLRRFRRAAAGSARTLASGLWAWSRHPNYFGETLFWWGLFLFGLAADPAWWWTIAGPLAITLMFVFVSVPMLDRRMLARRPDYAARMREVSALVPFPRRPAGV